MHPLVALLSSCLSTTGSFWDDLTQVQSLSDPPSPHFLSQIREEPWRGGLEPVPVEGIPLHNAQMIQGKIPSDLQGMLCRNGPGRIRIGDTQYGHWFDADGLVSQLCLDGETQTATFQAKYVETERFQAQQKMPQTTGDVPMATAGAWTKRGRGQLWENLLAIPTNPSNTNVLFLDNIKQGPPRLFAISEGGDPVELDSQTLNTIHKPQPFSFSPSGETVSSFFSAHYKKDPQTGDVYNHGVVLGPTETVVNIMKLSPLGQLLKQVKTPIPVSGVTFVHDNLLSENHFVLVIQPFSATSLGLITSVLGGNPLGQQFEFQPNDKDLPQGAVAMVFSKESLECVAQVPLPLLSTYHLVDAFEESDDTLTFRALIHDPPEARNKLEEGFKDLYTHTQLPLCQIREYQLHLKTQTMVSTRRVAPHADLCELPDVHSQAGYRKRYLWTNTRTEPSGWLDSLQQVDLETEDCSPVIWFGDNSYAGNPIFVPKANAQNEDDGYILTQIYRSDEHRSDIGILDAATMKQLALLRLDSHITYQFHGAWYPGVF